MTTLVHTVFLRKDVVTSNSVDLKTVLWLRESMVQDSITDYIDTAQENSSQLNVTYRMTIIFVQIVP